MIYFILIIDLWEVVKWILYSKNGGINLQLFFDCTCNYFIGASIYSLTQTYFIHCFTGIFFLKIGSEVEMKIKIKDKNSKLRK
jgi:hypothetical protein